MLDKISALRAWPFGLRIGITAIVLGAVFAFQIPLETEVPGEPFLLFFIVVIASAMAFGQPIGFLACGASTFLSLYFFEPYGVPTVDQVADLIKIELYALVAGFSVAAVARLRGAIAVELRVRRSLEESERKKTILLKDLVHRVANNFAVVAALIQSKAATVKEPDAKVALSDAVDQVAMMARLHRNLHSYTDATTLDSERFLLDLASDLKSSMGKARPVAIESVSVSRALSAEQAVPLGLIVNELVTNALKHAFPGGRSGTIRVTLEMEAHDRLVLTVEDDGVGLRSQDQTNGTGRGLVALLAEQLGGRLECSSTVQGASFCVAFPYGDPRPAPRVMLAEQGVA